MTAAPHKPFPASAPLAAANGAGMKRLQFELALEVSGARRPLADTVRDAARSAGAELLFVLPDRTGESSKAVVRLKEDGQETFLQVALVDGAYSVADDTAMDAALLGFARASVDLFRLMSADDAIHAPLNAG